MGRTMFAMRVGIKRKGMALGHIRAGLYHAATRKTFARLTAYVGCN
jgi:hypothetical protein